MASPSRSDIILAYRHIYKHLLRAVQYSKPARFVAQERVRNAFRNSNPQDYSAHRIERTLEFLDGAAKAKGLEHKVVKNLMHVWWEQKKLGSVKNIRQKVLPFRKVAYDEFNHTIRMLNESMGLCIK